MLVETPSPLWRVASILQEPLPEFRPAYYSPGMDAALERMLNLLLESERAGVAVLDSLAAEVKHPELKDLLLDAREDESHNAAALERLVREGGGTPSAATGPFAAKVAAVANMRGSARAADSRPGMGRAQDRRDARACAGGWSDPRVPAKNGQPPSPRNRMGPRRTYSADGHCRIDATKSLLRHEAAGAIIRLSVDA